MKSFNNWQLDKSELSNYKLNNRIKDYFITTPSNEHGILVYNIDERSMNSYSGLLAIYSKAEKPKLELNPANTLIWFSQNNTFSFLRKSNCIVFRKPAYNPNNFRGNLPFILLNTKENIFGFIEFDYNSIYYSLEEIDKENVKIVEIHSLELNISKKIKRTDEIVQLSKITWFDLKYFDRILEKYQEEISIESQKSKDLKKIINVINTVKSKITEDTDVHWAGYETPIELRTEIVEDLKLLNENNLDKLEIFKNHFLPTATFQEISLSNGWGDQYLDLSKEFDKLYNKLKNDTYNQKYFTQSEQSITTKFMNWFKRT